MPPEVKRKKEKASVLGGCGGEAKARCCFLMGISPPWACFHPSKGPFLNHVPSLTLTSPFLTIQQSKLRSDMDSFVFCFVLGHSF